MWGHTHPSGAACTFRTLHHRLQHPQILKEQRTMAGKLSRRRISTSFILFVTWGSHFVVQSAHSSHFTGPEGERLRQMLRTAAGSSDSSEDDWDDASCYPGYTSPPSEYGDEDEGDNSFERHPSKELTDEEPRGAERTFEGASSSPPETSDPVTLETLRMLSQTFGIPESQLLSTLTQLATQVSPSRSPSSAEGTRRDLLESKGATPPPPSKAAGEPARKSVGAIPKKTKPAPPTRTNTPSGEDDEASPPEDAASSDKVVKKQPPQLPPPKVRQAPNEGRQQQSPPPSQQHTPVDSAPDTLREPQVTTVREKARLLNQEQVLQGMAALPGNYAVLGGSPSGQINVKRQQHLTQENELDEEEESGELEEEGHGPQGKPNTKAADSARSAYTVKITYYGGGGGGGTLGRSGTSKGGSSSARIEVNPRNMETKNSGTLHEQSPKAKSFRGPSVGDDSSTNDGGAQNAITPEQVIAKMQEMLHGGDPEYAIEALEDLLEILKLKLEKNTSPRTHVESKYPSPYDIETDDAAGFSLVDADGEAGFDTHSGTPSGILKNKSKQHKQSKASDSPKDSDYSIFGSLRRTKNKKKKSAPSERREGSGVLTLLRRKKSIVEPSHGTIAQKGYKDESDATRDEKHEAFTGGSDEDHATGRHASSEHHVCFSLPDYSSDSTSSSAVGGEQARSFSGSSVESADRNEDRVVAPAGRKKGLLQKLFPKRKSHETSRDAVSRPPLEYIDIEDDYD